MSRTRVILAKAAITLACAGLLLLLRLDLAMWLQSEATHAYRKWKSSEVISSYLKQNKIRKLQLGAGEYMPAGWLNTDITLMFPGIAFLDITERFPVPDSSIHFVYSEQLIEHIGYNDGLKMLKESHRALAPGGVIRVSTPDLTRLVELFKADRPPDADEFVATSLTWFNWPRTPDPECYALNQILREWGHTFVYSPKMLKARMQEAGFTDIKQVRVGESDHPELQKLEYRETWAVKEANSYVSMVLEGTKQ